MESLNIHALCDSSSRGDRLSDSLNWLRRSECEMGARRRLRLLSCTRVLRALESRTEVCFGGGEEGAGRKDTVSRLHCLRAVSLVHTECSQGHVRPPPRVKL